jgi:hypothetical protein
MKPLAAVLENKNALKNSQNEMARAIVLTSCKETVKYPQ